jgi:hypothetical protein
VRRDRVGLLGGAEYLAEEWFGEDGALRRAVVRVGLQERELSAADAARAGVAPVAGLRRAPSAAAAEADPPACAP